MKDGIFTKEVIVFIMPSGKAESVLRDFDVKADTGDFWIVMLLFD